MSPPPTHEASKDVKKESATARLLGSGMSILQQLDAIVKCMVILTCKPLGTAGIAELMVFHPVRKPPLKQKVYFCDCDADSNAIKRSIPLRSD